ncbi:MULTISPECIES: ABC transporter ATP-binding protein [unclassified Cellulophaga]|uniref:ABC transporter ATP-binding protein n=1 Tax=unclassified Cellulophaga TaxID=2634405 RepID=UPI0026E3B065|nr:MULTISPECIES: ABC transporter ATP-binding protein [unclassified Cellulophaga]MDO6490457.1 ABC transporter ATP-binding protein [Cellulophaga sp. 2_MG-2023]MDO6494349.1 ABC transporter ATP-binding protein [Cellulophaga sp. 3_MG-2023]
MLKAVNLSKSYNGKIALKDVSFEVSKGEIFCLLGQNGAGKTTTINIFLGFLKKDGGKAFVLDKEVGKDNTSNLTAYIPETVHLYENLSGIENLNFFSQLAGFKYSTDELTSFLAKTGLQHNAINKRLSTYSKGMRQKVGIAVALAKNAEVIFMDEPTSGLDPKATAEFTKICKELAKMGKVIFMATHDIFNAVELGTTIGIMKEGVLAQQLKASEISAEQLNQLYLETI